MFRLESLKKQKDLAKQRSTQSKTSPKRSFAKSSLSETQKSSISEDTRGEELEGIPEFMIFDNDVFQGSSVSQNGMVC